MAESLLSNNSPAPEPVFPRFKPLALADREILRQILWDYQAETSELTCTNLFIWQSHYGYQWSRDRDRLLVVSAVPGGGGWARPPVGPLLRVDLCRQVLGSPQPSPPEAGGEGVGDVAGFRNHKELNRFHFFPSPPMGERARVRGK